MSAPSGFNDFVNQALRGSLLYDTTITMLHYPTQVVHDRTCRHEPGTASEIKNRSDKNVLQTLRRETNCESRRMRTKVEGAQGGIFGCAASDFGEGTCIDY